MRAVCSPWTRPVWLLLLALGPGCSSIGVRPTDGATLDEAWRASAITRDELSPRTRQTLRRWDLDGLYARSPADAAEKLHHFATVNPSPDLLFALAEVSYLRGRQAEKDGTADAVGHYYLCAGYAYHYLFDDPHAVRAEKDNAVRPAEHRDEPPAPAGQSPPARIPPQVFDPRFRVACDLYNAGLAKCIAAAQRVGRLDPGKRLQIPGPDGKDVTLSVRHHGFVWKPEEFGRLLFCADFAVVGLANHHRTYGLGVPLIATRRPDAPRPPNTYYPPNVTFPATAFLRFEGGLDDLARCRSSRLELVDPLRVQRVAIAGRPVPLETDVTTPLAFFLTHVRLNAAGYTGFLRPDLIQDDTGLHTLEPYQPGKIPVVLVHGLLGNPTTWAPLFNDLQADPAIRRRFQFWFYFYPTGNPYLVTAADLRRALARLRQDLDPQRRDPALDDMVFVGHSMGGLVSRLMTIDGGDDFWKLVSDVPFDTLRLQPATRSELRNTFYFERQATVTRAVFMATPHQGSNLSPSLVGRVGDILAGMTREVTETARDVAEENPELADRLRSRHLPSSVDLLAPDSPALQLIAHRAKPDRVHYHSVVGVVPRQDLLLERLFGGGYRKPGDGVVPYQSAHLEGVDSEIVVPADHYHVHHHPLAVLEVRRILLEHLREFEERRSDGVRQVSAGKPDAPAREDRR
jgi:pimeloyl-ACP methyl ester carboxylesterase